MNNNVTQRLITQRKTGCQAQRAKRKSNGWFGISGIENLMNSNSPLTRRVNCKNLGLCTQQTVSFLQSFHRTNDLGTYF